MRATFLLLCLALTSCGRPAASALPPEFDRTVDPAKAAMLCDPEAFRLSIRYRADAASLDESYSRRVLIDPEALVARFPNQGGEDQYQGALIRYELCGPFVVRLAGDFLNANTAGEMGAIEPFVAVSVSADNRHLYPWTERGSTRLGICDERLPIWRDCPADYAVRIDLAYRPAAERLSIHEWAVSDYLLNLHEGDRTTERRSEVPALLSLWWSRAHP